MGGNRAAYASTAPTRRHGGDGDGVHSVRRGHPTRMGNNQEAYDGDGDNDEEDGVFDASSPTAKTQNGVNGRSFAAYQRQRPASGDEDDEDEEYDEEEEAELAEREREAMREREEMRQRFTFKEYKRRNLRSDIVSAMRRKRRMLMRNENLRFRELYKPPEPMVLFTVIAMVTIVSLILTKSWPFY